MEGWVCINMDLTRNWTLATSNLMGWVDVTSFLETLKVEDTETRRNALIGRHETGSSSALTGDLWRIILERLPVLALGQAACVCRLWRSIAADPEVLAAAFRTPWRLKEVVGRPLSSSFWRGQLGQFVISHTLQRTDTIAGLAVKYRVQVILLIRLRNSIRHLYLSGVDPRTGTEKRCV